MGRTAPHNQGASTIEVHLNGIRNTAVDQLAGQSSQILHKFTRTATIPLALPSGAADPITAFSDTQLYSKAPGVMLVFSRGSPLFEAPNKGGGLVY